MNRNAWSESDRQEFDAIIDEAWDSSHSQTRRTDAFLSRLRDAEQAQRLFAADALGDCTRRGAGAMLKASRKARTTVAVSHEGKMLTKPRTIGTQRKDADGRAYYEQTLFDLMTWDEIESKRREYLRQIDTYDGSVGTMDKLLALRDLAPAAATPRGAASALGTTVEHWLGEEKSA